MAAQTGQSSEKKHTRVERERDRRATLEGHHTRLSWTEPAQCGHREAKAVRKPEEEVGHFPRKRR